MKWDPAQYGKYATERARPFLDLVERIGAGAPRRVVDLGCGPGNMTVLLADKWPGATIEGVDSSPEMIEKAKELASPVAFRVEDVRTWQQPLDADVIVSNATLQWVPDHMQLLERWARALPEGGWLALQVPDNFASPSHTIIRQVAESTEFRPLLRGKLREVAAVHSAAYYAGVLLAVGLAVDAWETTYLHVLHGKDPVLEWVRGTALRPVLDALSAEDGARFSSTLAARLRKEYPETVHGTLLPFRRIFVVAHKPSQNPKPAKT